MKLIKPLCIVIFGYFLVACHQTKSETQTQLTSRALKGKSIHALKNNLQSCTTQLEQIEATLKKINQSENPSSYAKIYARSLLKQKKALKIKKLKLEFELALEEERFKDAEKVLPKLENAGISTPLLQALTSKVSIAKKKSEAQGATAPAITTYAAIYAPIAALEQTS